MTKNPFDDDSSLKAGSRPRRYEEPTAPTDSPSAPRTNSPFDERVEEALFPASPPPKKDG